MQNWHQPVMGPLLQMETASRICNHIALERSSWRIRHKKRKKESSDPFDDDEVNPYAAWNQVLIGGEPGPGSAGMFEPGSPLSQLLSVTI